MNTNHPSLLVLAGLCTLIGGCLADRAVMTSEFPPEDFYLEVRTTVTTADGLQETQRFQVWESGFAVYREADLSLITPEPGSLRLPLFQRVSAYQMDEESTRTLSRLLYNSGLADLPAVVGNPTPRGDVITVLWRHLSEKQVQAHEIQGRMARVLHVINSFLPEGTKNSNPFQLQPPMSGEPEPSHLANVPEVLDSMPASLDFHLEELATRFPEDVEVLKDTFALAYAENRLDVAVSILERLEVLRDDNGRIFPPNTGEDLPERLRRLF